MAEPVQQKISQELAMPMDGKGPRVKRPAERYCAFCGSDADGHGLATERFDEVFCSDGHADEFVNELRAARIQAAALRTAEPATTETARPEQSAARAAKLRGWKRYLKMGACCGLPLLALVLLAGDGGALLGAAGALLPLLAVLACPLGMYFMMRSMAKMEHKENPEDKRAQK